MRNEIFRYKLAIAFYGLGLTGWILAGCATQPASSGTATSVASTNSVATTSAATAGGAELWARNCGHCHNIRSPSSYSNAQWEVAVMHMRIRANLTADEHKKILAFLKSAH
ncbi:MAG TPA: hypothetical protein VL361_13470 [Candidatus Limnocylindrales bacterium]|jgi:hypothetical protein|nr:hypothetical protein [Candidatus Limnocylindrales bacterium]